MIDEEKIMEVGKTKKICLIASIGGHMTQLQQLKSLYEDYDYYFVTEYIEKASCMNTESRVRYVKITERTSPKFVFVYFVNTIKSFYYLIKENPDVIISTGASMAIPTCYFGKLLGKKIIFIESFAKVKTPNKTGRIIYPIADLFIVQWEGLLSYYKKAVYGGSIY